MSKTFGLITLEEGNPQIFARITPEMGIRDLVQMAPIFAKDDLVDSFSEVGTVCFSEMKDIGRKFVLFFFSLQKVFFFSVCWGINPIFRIFCFAGSVWLGKIGEAQCVTIGTLRNRTFGRNLFLSNGNKNNHSTLDRVKKNYNLI